MKQLTDNKLIFATNLFSTRLTKDDFFVIDERRPKNINGRRETQQ